MADYLTSTADLTLVADAIRAKGGTSGQLTYPGGFVSAIQNIPSSVLGIPGEHIGSYTVNDGILVFTVQQEDYTNYNNFYIKKQGVSFGLFVLNIVVDSTSAKIWYALHDSSSTPQVATSYVSVEESGVNYEFTVNLSGSGGDYYSGSVDVYAITV